MTGWIPVDERLPEIGRWVLVEDPGAEPGMVIATWEGDGWVCDDLDWDLQVENVNYWQPLPAGPENRK